MFFHLYETPFTPFGFPTLIVSSLSGGMGQGRSKWEKNKFALKCISGKIKCFKTIYIYIYFFKWKTGLSRTHPASLMENSIIIIFFSETTPKVLCTLILAHCGGSGGTQYYGNNHPRPLPPLGRPLPLGTSVSPSKSPLPWSKVPPSEQIILLSWLCIYNCLVNGIFLLIQCQKMSLFCPAPLTFQRSQMKNLSLVSKSMSVLC